MKKIVQIMPSYGEFEAVFFSYDDGDLFCEPVLCWALVSETPYVDNGDEEKRYIEGQVLINKGSKFGGINDTPETVGFLGYLYAMLPEEKIKERMDHFKDQAKQLIELRKSGHLPTIEPEIPK